MTETLTDIHEAKLLLVDDAPSILELLVTILRREGYTHILTATNVADALRLAQREHPAALILDVMLPDGDGFSLFTELRRFLDAPVLFLSARDEDTARLKGLGLGADDYITKPFLPAELILRLNAVLRRTYRLPQRELLRLGAISVDFSTSTVHGNGADKPLTAKEFALLKKLAAKRGQIVTIDSLCASLWNTENFGYENTLMVHIRRLREKIELDPSKPRYLVTVRGLGYRLLNEEDV